MRLSLWLAGALLLLAGCQTQRPLYYWGNYENLTYLTYAKPAKATLEVQREQLEEDLQKAQGDNLTPNPGLHAQLGYVYFQLGHPDDAVNEFMKEKALFPESATFMDGMIEKIKGAAAK